MKIAVEKELCVGCALCESACPDIFEMLGTVSVVKNPLVPQDQEEAALQVAKDCPTAAIKIEE